MLRRMLGKGGTVVVPIPEAGVCTPYPIPIPITSGLLSYVSVFNSCDNFKLNDATGAITADGDTCAYNVDISLNNNNAKTLGASGTAIKAPKYVDNGAGDVYWRTENPSAAPNMTINPSWRINTDYKTSIFLVRCSDVTDNVSTRIGLHGASFILRFSATGFLEVFNSGISTSSLAGVDNEWFVMSCRTNNDIVLGYDKSYDNIKGSVSTISANFEFWSERSFFGWLNDMREVAVYSGALSDTDLDTMVDYMKTKWGL